MRIITYLPDVRNTLGEKDDYVITGLNLQIHYDQQKKLDFILIFPTELTELLRKNENLCLSCFNDNFLLLDKEQYFHTL